MSLKFRFTLDSVVMTQDPLGWESFTMSLRYSYDSMVMVREYSNAITLYGEDYTTIETMYQANDISTRVPFKAEYTLDYGTTYETILDGSILLARTEMDPLRRRAKITVEDYYFTTSVYANRSLPVPMDSATTIGGISNLPPTPYYTGEAGDLNRQAFYLYDEALDFVIAYISDNQITVTDEWYASLDIADLAPEIYGLGFAADIPALTFQSLYTSFAKLFNLSMCVLITPPNFKLVICEAADFRVTTAAITIDAPIAFKYSLDPEKIGQSIIVGDNKSPLNDVINIDPDYGTTYNAAIVYDVTNTTYQFEYQVSSELGGKGSINLSPDYGYMMQELFKSTPGGVSITGMVLTAGVYEAYFLDPAVPPVKEQTSYWALTQATYPGGQMGFDTWSRPWMYNQAILDRYVFASSCLHPPVDPESKALTFYPQDGYSLSQANSTLSESSGYSGPQSQTLNVLPIYQDASNSRTQAAFDQSFFGFTEQSYAKGVNKYVLSGRLKINVVNAMANDNLVVYPCLVVNANGVDYAHSLYDAISVGPNNSDSWNELFNSYEILLPEGAKVSFALIIEVTPYDHTTPDVLAYSAQWDSDGTTDESYFTFTRDYTGEQYEIIPNQSDEALIYKVDIDAIVPIDEWTALFNDPRKCIQINDPMVCKGWVEDVSYTPAKGTMTGVLITNHNNLFV